MPFEPGAAVLCLDDEWIVSRGVFVEPAPVAGRCYRPCQVADGFLSFPEFPAYEWREDHFQPLDDRGSFDWRREPVLAGV